MVKYMKKKLMICSSNMPHLYSLRNNLDNKKKKNIYIIEVLKIEKENSISNINKPNLLINNIKNYYHYKNYNITLISKNRKKYIPNKIFEDNKNNLNLII